MVSETGIEPSCVAIGQKLISVHQKESTTMVTTFPTFVTHQGVSSDPSKSDYIVRNKVDYFSLKIALCRSL